MKLPTKNLIGAAFIAVPIFIVLVVGVMLLRAGDSGPTEPEKQQRYREIAELQKARDAETQRLKADPVETDLAEPVKRFATVEDYFSDGNPNPLTHRQGLPRFERDVSASHRKKIIKRDGGCCLVCGSTYKLEVDHRIALMNNGDNSDENLGTLCDSCHTEKTRYDWSIKKRRRKMGEGH